LSTLALEPSSGAQAGRFAQLARWADLILLAIALPVFVLADLPIVGYVAVAAGWLAQRAVQHWAGARVAQASERTSALRLIAGTFMARLWLVTIAILLVGILADDEAGLSAAVLAAALVTANLAGEALTRSPIEEPEAR
jgi:hypothetical protein